MNNLKRPVLNLTNVTLESARNSRPSQRESANKYGPCGGEFASRIGREGE